MHPRPNASKPGAVRTTPASYSAPQPVLVDEYELLRPLGSGTMGQVFLAQELVLDRRVAVKFISQESPSATLRERFLVEARAIARLQHPNVVSIYRVGVVNGHPYLASEFVRGKSLEKAPLPCPGAAPSTSEPSWPADWRRRISRGSFIGISKPRISDGKI